MAGLIKSYPATAGQFDSGHAAPALHRQLGTSDPPIFQLGDLEIQIARANRPRACPSPAPPWRSI
jgi:hypothetical protein